MIPGNPTLAQAAPRFMAENAKISPLAGQALIPAKAQR
jgi:hypothetical protein